MRDWLRLTKPGIVLSNGLMAAAGAALGPPVSVVTYAQIVFGTAALVAGCGALNMVIERATDRQMARTASRPVASRRVSAPAATAFGVTLLGAGGLLLAPTTLYGLGFGLLATFVYLAVYTPMKRFTWWAVPAGAVSGALPPVIGWAAAGGGLSVIPAVLFAMLFIWQLPHFIAIGIRGHRDYAAAGLHIGVPPDSRPRAVLGARLLAVALVPLTVLLGLELGGGPVFWVLGLASSLGIAAVAMRSAAEPDLWARRVFLSSLGYLLAFSLALFLG